MDIILALVHFLTIVGTSESVTVGIFSGLAHNAASVNLIDMITTIKGLNYELFLFSMPLIMNHAMEVVSLFYATNYEPCNGSVINMYIQGTA